MCALARNDIFLNLMASDTPPRRFCGRIMEVTVWNAYEKFRCIASSCPDSCCKDWEVDVDETAAESYRNLSGDLGDRLRQVMKTEDGETAMILEQGRCPMWRQDGLCQSQAELGHEALCKVCREFPRLHQDYGDFAQWGLELSCPEAARLIFEDMGVTTGTAPEAAPPDYDPELMEILLRSQEEMLLFWENTDFSVPQALAVMLLYGYQVQGALDGGEYVPLEPEKCLKTARGFAGAADTQGFIRFFRELEILTDRWQERLSRPCKGSWDIRLKKLAVYFVRRYWLQAVWDFDLTCRVKFAVAACVLVNLLGGDPVQTAQLFSKEIENDPDNVDAILDGAYTAQALTDANLLGLLFA